MLHKFFFEKKFRFWIKLLLNYCFQEMKVYCSCIFSIWISGWFSPLYHLIFQANFIKNRDVWVLCTRVYLTFRSSLSTLCLFCQYFPVTSAVVVSVMDAGGALPNHLLIMIVQSLMPNVHGIPITLSECWNIAVCQLGLTYMHGPIPSCWKLLSFLAFLIPLVALNSTIDDITITSIPEKSDTKMPCWDQPDSVITVNLRLDNGSARYAGDTNIPCELQIG